MFRRSIFASAFAIGAVLSAGAALLDVQNSTRLNVILLSVEGMRADSVSAIRTPKFWSATKHAVRFPNHRTVSAWTAPNVISLLTGISPFDQGIHTRGNSLPAGWTLPLEELSIAGWRVAGLQPFMRIDLFRNLGVTLETVGSLFTWLGARALGDEPFFLWSHYVGTHLPYKPEPGNAELVRQLLTKADAAQRKRLKQVVTQPVVPAGTVKFSPGDAPFVVKLHQIGFQEFDDWFGRFWTFFGRSGLRRNTILIVTADHGEELLERGQVGHASTTRAGHLFDEVVRTQLFAWLPPGHADGGPRVVTSPTNHLDIMPTLLRWLGRSSTRSLPGEYLTDIPPNRAWQAVTSHAGFAEKDPKNLSKFHFARLEQPWKLHLEFTAGRQTNARLFNLQVDPEERHDLAPSMPARVQDIADRLIPSILAMRPPSSAASRSHEGENEKPQWQQPSDSGAVGYDDFAGKFQLRWRGQKDGEYVVQYEAGQGALQLKGELTVRGTVKDFGRVSRRYWNTWVTPYGRIRLRVGIAGRTDLWSDWLEMEVRK